MTPPRDVLRLSEVDPRHLSRELADVREAVDGNSRKIDLQGVAISHIADQVGTQGVLLEKIADRLGVIEDIPPPRALASLLILVSLLSAFVAAGGTYLIARS